LHIYQSKFVTNESNQAFLIFVSSMWFQQFYLFSAAIVPEKAHHRVSAKTLEISLKKKIPGKWKTLLSSAGGNCSSWSSLLKYAQEPWYGLHAKVHRISFYRPCGTQRITDFRFTVVSL